jgi:hypothetical protein
MSTTRRIGTLIEKEGERPDISLGTEGVLTDADRSAGYTERPVYVIDEDPPEPVVPEEMPEGYFGDPR